MNGLSIPDYEQASLCRPGVRYHLAQAFGLRATLNRCHIVRDECQMYRGQPAAFSLMHSFPAYSRDQYVSDPHMKESVCFWLLQKWISMFFSKQGSLDPCSLSSIQLYQAWFGQSSWLEQQKTKFPLDQLKHFSWMDLNLKIEKEFHVCVQVCGTSKIRHRTHLLPITS